MDTTTAGLVAGDAALEGGDPRVYLEGIEGLTYTQRQRAELLALVIVAQARGLVTGGALWLGPIQPEDRRRARSRVFSVAEVELVAERAIESGEPVAVVAGAVPRAYKWRAETDRAEALVVGDICLVRWWRAQAGTAPYGASEHDVEPVMSVGRWLLRLREITAIDIAD